MIKPFSVNVPQQVLDDLKLRLSLTRWPDEIMKSNWDYGADLSYMKELISYWKDTFDWRKVENEINAYPNFIADIEGHQVHFMHLMTFNISSSSEYCILINLCFNCNCNSKNYFCNHKVCSILHSSIYFTLIS